jgi:hypothetical protein
VSAATVVPAGTADKVVGRLFPAESPYRHDPDLWARERLGLESWSVPRRIRESVRDHRHTAVKACHDSAKTHTAASVASWWLDVHPVGDAFVVTSAPTNDQVRGLLWRDIQSMHIAGGLRGRVTLDARWLMDERLVAFGRKTQDVSDPAQAMQSFQGVHARHVLVIIDESCGVPKWLFDAADSIAANENARVLAIGNPDSPATHFAEIFKPGSKWNRITVSAFDTPAFTGEPVSPRLLELLIGPTYVEEMRALGEDSHLYQSKVLGEFPNVGNDALFPPALLERACEADLPGTDLGGYGGDVARFGDSETVLYRNRGGQIRLTHAARHQATTETAEQFAGHVRRPSVGSLPTLVDADGVGGGVVDQMRANGVPVLEFHGGQPAHDTTRFYNRRSEVFWLLREGMEAFEVDLDPDDKELLAQLGRMRWGTDGRGRIKVESKDEMRKRGVKSPDRADGAAMAFAAPPLLNLREEAERAVEQAVARRDAGFVDWGAAPAPEAFELSHDILDREL